MTLGSHQQTVGVSQQHITPRWILNPLGRFDLDPCASSPRPWACADTNIALPRDGLATRWRGRVWLNPPFDTRCIALWLAAMARHNRGVVLVHARTDTRWFGIVWSSAAALLFLAGRVIFHRPDGSLCATRDGKVANSGAPVVLAAFGPRDSEALADCGLRGQFVPLLIRPAVLLAAIERRTWRALVAEALAASRSPVRVADLFEALRLCAKGRGNRFVREKIRQTLQRGAGRRVGRDQWVAA